MGLGIQQLNIFNSQALSSVQVWKIAGTEVDTCPWQRLSAYYLWDKTQVSAELASLNGTLIQHWKHKMQTHKHTNTRQQDPHYLMLCDLRVKVQWLYSGESLLRWKLFTEQFVLVVMSMYFVKRWDCLRVYEINSVFKTEKCMKLTLLKWKR